MFCIIIYGCASQAAPENQTKLQSSKSFSVYALSRGKGVPEPTREILNQIENLLAKANGKGVSIEISKSRIGIEGETRLCASFSNSEAADDLLTQVQQLIKGVDLINIVVEPCSMKP